MYIYKYRWPNGHLIQLSLLLRSAIRHASRARVYAFVGPVIFNIAFKISISNFSLLSQFQISSKSCCKRPVPNFMRCSSAHTALSTSKIHMYSPIYSMNLKVTMPAAKSIWPRRWTRFSIHCIRKCSPYSIHNTRSMISKCLNICKTRICNRKIRRCQFREPLILHWRQRLHWCQSVSCTQFSTNGSGD